MKRKSIHNWLRCAFQIFPGSRLLSASTLVCLFFSCIPASAQQWEVIGSELEIASAASNYTSVTMVTEGTTSIPYVIFTESDIAKVKRYDGVSWQQVGGNVSTGNATYTRIYSDASNRLYATYVDAANGNRLAVKTYNAGSASWEPINGDAANLYVSTGSVTNGIGQYSSTARSAATIDNNGNFYIAYADGANLNPFVKRFTNTGWEVVGGTAVSAQRAIGVGIAVDSTNDTPYLVYLNQASATSSTGNLVVYRLSNNTWESIPVPNPIPGGSATTGATTALRHAAITFNSNWNPLISYFNASNSNRATVITFNKETLTWSYGGTLSTRDITNNNLYRDRPGNVYSAFTDAMSNGSGRSVARVFKQAAGTNTWAELKSPDAVGVDEPAGNLSISVAEDSSQPYIVYTKAGISSVVTPVVRRYALTAEPPPPPADSVVTTPKQMEFLTRGLVAVRSGPSQVYLSWRLLGTDSSSISFNVYRDGIKLNDSPITGSTNYVDSTPTNGSYTIRPILNQVEMAAVPPVDVWSQIYKTIPLQLPPPGVTPSGETYTYTANDCSVGDVDGDGEYEVFLKWDPSNAKDNSQGGYTGNVYIDAYKLDGTRLWRVDLGRNIRAGAHYTQFMVYDFDGDGKAEMACKTADGTTDGTGIAIGDTAADFRNSNGYILTGPEFLTIFNGMTGAAMATENYIPARGSVSSWGDNYGNRVDRFVNAVAYLDGERPSLIMGRGYYTRLVRAAWDWRNGQLTLRWVFDSNAPGNAAYAGQGNHNMTIGDVDGDGKDEIINGSSAINDDGKGLYAPGHGHGDALHMTDLDPDRPGQEVWQNHEDPGSYGNYGLEFRDAKTGQPIWGPLTGNNGDIGRSMAADIDPTYKGYEVWGSRGNLYNCKGLQIGTTKPSVNFGLWWDGDPLRELLDGTRLDKWNYTTGTSNRLLTINDFGNAASINGTKANPNLSADLLGDWREEMLYRSSDNRNLLLFTTTIPTSMRLPTLMHDPQYRVAIAWQNSAYNQPPYPSYYIGDSMLPPPRPNIFIAGRGALPVKLLSFDAVRQGKTAQLKWSATNEFNADHYVVERSPNGTVFMPIATVPDKGNNGAVNHYVVSDNQPNAGVNYYRLKQVDRDGKVTWSTTRSLSFTGVKQLQLFPNPTSGTTRLQFTSGNSALILQVAMPDGRLLFQSKGSVSQLSSALNRRLPGMVRGYYNVTIIDNDERYTTKLLKQ